MKTEEKAESPEAPRPERKDGSPPLLFLTLPPSPPISHQTQSFTAGRPARRSLEPWAACPGPGCLPEQMGFTCCRRNLYTTLTTNIKAACRPRAGWWRNPAAGSALVASLTPTRLPSSSNPAQDDVLALISWSGPDGKAGRPCAVCHAQPQCPASGPTPCRKGREAPVLLRQGPRLWEWGVIRSWCSQSTS